MPRRPEPQTARHIIPDPRVRALRLSVHLFRVRTVFALWGLHLLLLHQSFLLYPDCGGRWASLGSGCVHSLLRRGSLAAKQPNQFCGGLILFCAGGDGKTPSISSAVAQRAALVVAARLACAAVEGGRTCRIRFGRRPLRAKDRVTTLSPSRVAAKKEIQLSLCVSLFFTVSFVRFAGA